ncbi:MAG TPA: DUF4296 domain-containing protein [Bacteroidales bacterium]|nr:DUF4296 domain-containing protein [Bacteroidales bacterium]HRZ50084.1 DUF4296 domain-containing protein [Bacteroidales bacterium]
MKYTIALIPVLLMILLFGSCRNHTRNYPADAEIPDSTMVKVVADMFLIEGAMIQLEYLQEKTNQSPLPYYEAVYRKYGITREQFLETLPLYTGNAGYAEKLYDRVIERINELEEEGKRQK